MLTFLTPGGGEGVFIEGGRQPERDGLPPATPPDVNASEAGERALWRRDRRPAIAPAGPQTSVESR